MIKWWKKKSKTEKFAIIAGVSVGVLAVAYCRKNNIDPTPKITNWNDVNYSPSQNGMCPSYYITMMQ